MRFKQSRTCRPASYVQASFQDLTRAMTIAAILMSAPAQAAVLMADQPLGSGAGKISENFLAHTSIQGTDPAATSDHQPLLAARGSFSDSSRPAGQLRVGGAGGGYHGPSHDGLPFEPEVPGQSIQQSIGQTLGQPAKPIQGKTPDQYSQKESHKPVAKASTSAAVKPPNKPPVKPMKKKQSPPQVMPTVYIIELNDGQVYKGTMKPAGRSYIISTENGPLTIKKDSIVRLTKVLPE